MRYYRTAISNGIFLLPLIVLLPLIPYYIRHRKRGLANPLRLLTFCSLVLYMLISWYFVVLPLPSEEWLATIQPAKANWLPGSYFRELTEETGFDIMERSTYFSAIGSNFALQYWFNIMMLVPLGMFVRYLFRLDAKRTAIICFSTTLLFEITQLTGVFFLFSKSYRSFDVDDLLCNFAGGMLGYWLMGKLAPLVERIENKAAAAYRNGAYISLLRRLAAFFIDLNIVWGLDRLIQLIGGSDPLARDMYTTANFVIKLFLYTVISTLLLKGATIGKWLLCFRVCRTGGTQAPVWRLILRYVILYNVVLLFVLIPHFALGLPEGAVQIITQLARMIAMGCLVYYVAVAWMFPARDYPWGTLSGTHVALIKPASAAQHPS